MILFAKGFRIKTGIDFVLEKPVRKGVSLEVDEEAFSDVKEICSFLILFYYHYYSNRNPFPAISVSSANCIS